MITLGIVLARRWLDNGVAHAAAARPTIILGEDRNKTEEQLEWLSKVNEAVATFPDAVQTTEKELDPWNPRPSGFEARGHYWTL